MKKITLIAAFLIAVFSYGQTLSGFVTNPSFEDGSVGTIAQFQTLNDWKLGGGSSGATGVSASIQSIDVHTGDGSNAIEVTSVSEINGTVNNDWNITLINTTYPFNGNNTDPIEVTVSFWAKTTDADPVSRNPNGDMRLLIKDTGSSTLGNKQARVLLETDTWVNITKTFTYDAAADYSLSLYFDVGKVDGTTQIDGITASVTGGATLDASPEPDVVTNYGFVTNPSFDDGSGGTIPQWQTLDNWKLEGNLATGNNYGIIQTNDIYDGSNALEVANEVAANEWQNKVTSADYAFDGNNTDPIEVTVSFWAKTTDTDPASGNPNGDLKVVVHDRVGSIDRTLRTNLTTNTWTNHTLTFTTFPAAPSYTLALSFQFGKLEGVTQIDGITSSVTGGASLGLEDISKNDSTVFIYPNPVMNVLNYRAEGVKNIEVYNLLGQKLKAEKAVGSINTSTFPKGSYILKLISENGAVSTKKFIKE